MHRVPAAGRPDDLDLRRLGEQADRLVVDAVDCVDLARDQRVEAGRAVVDDRHVGAVQPAAALLPVVGTLLEHDPDAGIELLERERARPDGLRPVLEALRNHEDVIVGQRIGQVGVGRVERKLDLVLVELLDVGHRLHRRRAAGLGVAAVQVERVDRVVGGELLSVRELDPLSQVEDPVLGPVLRLEALGQFGDAAFRPAPHSTRPLNRPWLTSIITESL